MSYRSFFRKKSAGKIINEDPDGEGGGLIKNLTVKDLTSFGIAALVGAGIFTTIGNASASGGPAVSLLFVFTAVACLFSALCYAEFASSIPVSGSAYTYAYVAFGELIAWIIGWDLLMEYAVGNIAVAISWSAYFSSLMKGFGIHIPEAYRMDYLSAFRAYETYTSATDHTTLPFYIKEGYNAWINAPQIGGIRIIVNLPAFFINAAITWLVYIGIKESKKTGNVLVAVKLVIVLLFIAAGAFYVQPENWMPFAPNGAAGVLKGVSAVFFAYIGFDAISTTAEESINPRKDLPRAMIYSLVICTILYVLVTLVLTGMVPYNELAVDDPLAYAFEQKGLNFLSGIIAFSAVVAMTSVLLVFQLGQPRIWMSMSRDGLLPAIFSRIHPVYKTPSFSTILTGIVVGVPAIFMNLTEVTDLCSIGTLFAFVIVCAGIMIKPETKEKRSSFKVPYISGKYYTPALFVITCISIIMIAGPEKTWHLFHPGALHLNFPLILFFLIFAFVAIKSYRNKLSFIPTLGLLTNLYLMTELGPVNWARFFIWLFLGLIIYFLYSRNHSHLAHKQG